MTARLCKGTTRLVIVNGDHAFKLARNALGAECNISEADIFVRASEDRRKMLCPVLACAPNGSMLIMPAVIILSQQEFKLLWENDSFPDWDYRGVGDADCPFEFKRDAWGWLEGRPVAVDYSDPAVHIL